MNGRGSVLLLTAPALVLMAVFLIGPLLAVIALSFTNYQLGAPSLSFVGNMQYQQDNLGTLLGSDNQSYTFGIQLNVPLFSAPGAAARRSVAQSQMRQAEHGLRYATDNARLELESAWTALEASAEVVTTQELALDLARESVAIAQTSYENGVITSAELNDAQVRLLQTEWLLMQAKYARITAAARAKVAAGVS